MFGTDGMFKSIRVARGVGAGTADNPHKVDGLTGATMTMNGVTRMLQEELVLYEAIFRRMGS